MGCCLAVVGAITLGRRSDGFSYGYQVEGQHCTLQFVDDERASASFAKENPSPFCLMNSAWSPNHHYAAVRDYTTGALSIAGGQNKTEWQSLYEMKDVSVLQYSPVWAADSHQFSFFVNTRDAPLIGIADVNNGVPGEPRYYQVDAARAVAYSPPVWSPDGQFLAFAAYASRGQGNEELYTLNVNTGAVRRLTNNHFRDDSPSWSPDGSQLVFTSAEDGYNELHIINVATGERNQLTRFTFGYTPSWSPDGRRIMFVSNIDHGHDLYLINVDGSGLRRLTNDHYSGSMFPIWLFSS